MATIKEDGALLSQYAYADKGIKVGDSVGQYIAVEVSYDSSKGGQATFKHINIILLKTTT
jgi:hypothetical protein